MPMDYNTMIEVSRPVWRAQAIEGVKARFHPDREDLPEIDEVDEILDTEIRDKFREVAPAIMASSTDREIDDEVDSIIRSAHSFIAERAGWVVSPMETEFNEHSECEHNWESDDIDEELESCDPDPYGIEYANWRKQQPIDLYNKLVEITEEAYRENYRFLLRWNRANKDKDFKIRNRRPRKLARYA